MKPFKFPKSLVKLVLKHKTFTVGVTRAPCGYEYLYIQKLSPFREREFVCGRTCSALTIKRRVERKAKELGWITE